MRGLEDSALKIQIHSIPIAKFRIKEASDPSPEKIKYVMFSKQYYRRQFILKCDSTINNYFLNITLVHVNSNYIMWQKWPIQEFSNSARAENTKFKSNDRNWLFKSSRNTCYCIWFVMVFQKYFFSKSFQYLLVMLHRNCILHICHALCKLIAFDI